jgi:peptidoglycan/LPS O-acetylase OafA/YrhL
MNAYDEPVLRKYMPELDVLRGVAVLSVFLYHGIYFSGSSVSTQGLARAFGQLTMFGWLGVNLFFVLSGFLITRILVDTKGKPDYFRKFYLRRALRILPIYLVVLVVLLLLRLVLWRYVVISLLFLSNYSGAMGLVGYGPLWSLSVEEQFYLLWPALVGAVSRRTLTIIGVSFVLIDPLLRWLSFTGRLPLGDVHSSTLLVLDNLALGALAAMFARSRFGSRRNAIQVAGALVFAGLLVLAAGLHYGILHRDNPVGATMQTVPANLLFTGVLLWMLGRRPAWVVRWPGAPLRFFGYISYGLYLTNFLVTTMYIRTVLHYNPASRLVHVYPKMVLAGSLSVLVAWLSRRYFEEYFLRVRVDGRLHTLPSTGR